MTGCLFSIIIESNVAVVSLQANFPHASRRIVLEGDSSARPPAGGGVPASQKTPLLLQGIPHRPRSPLNPPPAAGYGGIPAVAEWTDPEYASPYAEIVAYLHDYLLDPILNTLLTALLKCH